MVSYKKIKQMVSYKKCVWPRTVKRTLSIDSN